jgi:O-antigen ligase
MAILFLMAGLSNEDKRWLPMLLVVLMGLSLLLGLLQFSGAGFYIPLINGTPGEVSGPFANRNHFALFLAIAWLVAPAWAFAERKWLRWSAPIALGIALLSLLMILATGSRAGLMLGGLALILGFLLAKRDVQRALRHRPRWVFPAVVAGLIVVIATFLLLSVAADRAVSLNRLLAADTGQDMRTRGLPTVFAAILTYFPIGSGLGGFDPIFRLNEPIDLLKPTYFNHAHNDFLEIALDAGVLGLSMVAAGLAWGAWASVQAWRGGNRFSKLGSAILLLVIVASLVDYPIRTPLILGITTIAAVWLSGRRAPDADSRPALPHIA